MNGGARLAIAVLAAACSSAPDPDPWRAFANGLAHDRELPAATLPRARAVAVAVARELDRRGIDPNFDAAGRERAWKKYGDDRIGTCGHLAGVLGRTLVETGVAPSAVHTIVGMRVRPTLGDRPRPYLGRDWLNADHAAVLVIADGETAVFDPWKHGRAHGEFAAFGTSEWCGMSATEWLGQMRADDYVEFHLEDAADNHDIDRLIADLTAVSSR